MWCTESRFRQFELLTAYPALAATGMPRRMQPIKAPRQMYVTETESESIPAMSKHYMVKASAPIDETEAGI